MMNDGNGKNQKINYIAIFKCITKFNDLKKFFLLGFNKRLQCRDFGFNLI